MRTFAVIGSVSLVVFAVACSSADASDPAAESSSSEQDVTSAAQCKGLLPHNCRVCDDGSTACAHWAVKGNKCVIETCPAPETACTGALPKVCEVCSDGSTKCAHWAKKDGKCAVEVCPPECTQASDCKGVLPHVMTICSDGKAHGAQHVCNAGKCGIEVCPK